MNDDVKAAVEWLRGVASIDPDDGPVAKLVRHLDGEPARQAAAVAAAREEQREACALHVVSANPGAYTAGEYAEDVRAAPLTATPLAGRSAELEALSKILNSTINLEQARADDWKQRALSTAAERDALAEALRQANENLARASADYLRDTKVLRAQVDAVRALCASFDRGGGLMWPGEVLAAMDGAKP